MLKKYLFIVRDAKGLVITSQEVTERSPLSLAHAMMDAARIVEPERLVECCEVWFRTEQHNMTLLATAF